MTGWIEGAEVVLRTSGWAQETYGPTEKIGKVYANGNFVLAGDTSRQQWRPRSDYAMKTGGDGFSRQALVLLTPEVKERVTKVRAVTGAAKRLLDESERLSKIARSGDEDAILSAVAALTA